MSLPKTERGLDASRLGLHAQGLGTQNHPSVVSTPCTCRLHFKSGSLKGRGGPTAPAGAVGTRTFKQELESGLKQELESGASLFQQLLKRPPAVVESPAGALKSDAFDHRLEV